MTAPIDQSLSWRTVVERIARTENPRHRKMLETLAGHLRAERDQSLEDLMATLVPEPSYHLWKNGADYGPKGHSGVRAFYAELVESKRGILEYAIERIVVDDDNIVTEGLIRAYQAGAIARGFGFNVPDVDATYLVPYRAVILWPFNAAGEMLGEDGYSTFDPDWAELVAPEDLPPAYLAQFRGHLIVEALAYLALNGSLGTGFREESLEAGLARAPAFIGVDSGSTDGGPYYLGSGDWIWSMAAYERDLGLGLRGAHRLGVPLIVGSCGGGGADAAVDGYLAMVDRLASDAGFAVRVACVYCEPDRELLVRKYQRGDLRPLPGAPVIDEGILRQPGHIVAMAGAEPIQDALDLGADVVLLGRCADAAIFAALPIARGCDPGPVWNAAKIVECGSAAATNRKGQDSILCTIDDDGFVLEPLDPDLRCTPASVAAHTLYETADPYRLIMPSGTLDARAATYVALDDRRVRVRGGTFTAADTYTAKLEGAAPVGYLSSFWGSIRDPVILAQLPSWCDSLEAQIRNRLGGTWSDAYRIDIKVYGANGTIGEKTDAVPREAVVVFDLVGDSQEAASGMARAAYHVALHWPVKEWKAGSITTFAHPYSAPVVDRGQVFRFTLNHQLVIDEGERDQVFRITLQEVGRR